MDWLCKWIEPSVLANLIVAGAAIWYTIETQKLRLTAVAQLEKMAQQVNLAETAAAQALNASFFQLFPIVERHHSHRVAELRRFAQNDLTEKCKGARTKGLKLKDYDPAAAIKVSNVANYYESLAMLIEHSNGKLLPDTRKLFMDMVQMSTYRVWGVISENIDVIHMTPENVGTWAGSFEKLYFDICTFNQSLTPNAKAKLNRVDAQTTVQPDGSGS